MNLQIFPQVLFERVEILSYHKHFRRYLFIYTFSCSYFFILLCAYTCYLVSVWRNVYILFHFCSLIVFFLLLSMRNIFLDHVGIRSCFLYSRRGNKTVLMFTFGTQLVDLMCNRLSLSKLVLLGTFQVGWHLEPAMVDASKSKLICRLHFLNFKTLLAKSLVLFEILKVPL